MKFYKIILLFGLFSFFKANAQTIHLTQVALSTYSSFQSFSGKIEINDSFVVFTTYTITDSGKDSTVEKERIMKKKNGYVKTRVPNGANNYEYSLSSDKTEKKSGIYFVALTFVPNNNGDRKILIFKGKLQN